MLNVTRLVKPGGVADVGGRSIIRRSEQGARFIAEIAPQSREIHDRIAARLGADRVEALLDDREILLELLNEDGPARARAFAARLTWSTPRRLDAWKA